METRRLEALRRYDFDTVMFQVNARMWADPAYRAAAEELLDECGRRDIGVMAIKAAARKPWPTDGANERFATTWYEPWTDPDAIAEHVRFTLSVPGVHAFCTPGDVAVLRQALGAANVFVPMDEPERERLVAAAREALIFPMPTG